MTACQPHFRLIYALIFSLIISGIHSVKILLILTACLVCVVAILRACYPFSLKTYAKKWVKFNLFTLLLWLTLSWQINTTGVAFSAHGVELASLISLRANLILLTMWLLLAKMSDTRLVQAVAKLPLPAKLIQLFVLTVRYVALLGELNQKMEIAMKARGYQPKCNVRTLKFTAQRVALLLIHAMARAERAEMALKARGFQFGDNRRKNERT